MTERLARRSFLLDRCLTTDAFFSGQEMARRPVSLHIHHFGFLPVTITGKPCLLESSYWRWELNVSGYIIISNTHFDDPISNQLSSQTAFNRNIRTPPPIYISCRSHIELHLSVFFLSTSLTGPPTLFAENLSRFVEICPTLIKKLLWIVWA